MPVKPLKLIIYSLGILILLGFTVTATLAANKPFLGVGSHSSEDFTATATASLTPSTTATETVTATSTETQTASPTATVYLSKTPEPTRSYVKFEGQITAINNDLWTIGDQIVQVTNQTEVDDNPVLGDTVSVKAIVQADGSYLALEIDKVKQMMTETPQATKVDFEEENETNDDDHEEGEYYHQPGMTSTPPSSGYNNEDHHKHSDDDDGEHQSNYKSTTTSPRGGRDD